MNKYQEALDYLRRIGGDGYYKKQREKSFDVLQELVDKATPKKTANQSHGQMMNHASLESICKGEIK